MRYFLFVACLCLAVIPVTALAEDNLILNPGFDIGSDPYGVESIPHWNEYSESVSDIWFTFGMEEYLSSGIAQYYNSPSNSLKIGAANGPFVSGEGYAWQNFSVTAGLTYYAQAYLKSITGFPTFPDVDGYILRDGTKAWISLRWKDVASNVISVKDSSEYLTGRSDDWLQFSVADVAPVDAVSGDVLLRLWSPPLEGYTRIAYFDDVLVTTGSGSIVPEPISASLFLLGAATLAARSLRRKKV